MKTKKGTNGKMWMTTIMNSRMMTTVTTTMMMKSLP